MDPPIVVAGGARLLRRPLRAADEVLVLLFDPEVRRVVGQIRENGHHRRVRVGLPERVVQSAVEVRNQRYHQVRGGFPPELRDQSHVGLVIRADDAVQDLQHGEGADREPLLQHLVVQIFSPDARQITEEIQRLQHFLQVDQADLPRPLLLFDHRL